MFVNGDRVTNEKGETFIVHEHLWYGVVVAIPDYTPTRTIALRAETLILKQHTSF